MQNQEQSLVSVTTALEIPRSNPTRQPWTPPQHILDWPATIITWMDNTRTRDHCGSWCQQGYQKQDIASFFNEFGMTKEMLVMHRQDVPPTQNQGSYPIDRIFVTWAICNTTCGYLSGLDAIGDHRCLWINLPETHIFGTTMPAITTLKTQQLKTEDPCTIKKYLEYLENHITQHNLLAKTQALSSKLTGEHNLTDKIRNQLNNIETLWIQGMLKAEWQCQKLHTQPYGWMPLITQLIQSIKYWRYSWKHVMGQPYHARILYWLKKLYH